MSVILKSVGLLQSFFSQADDMIRWFTILGSNASCVEGPWTGVFIADSFDKKKGSIWISETEMPDVSKTWAPKASWYTFWDFSK